MRARGALGPVAWEVPAVASSVADMKVQLLATRALVYRAATTLGQTRESGLSASITKVCQRGAFASATAAIRNLGGSGVLGRTRRSVR